MGNLTWEREDLGGNLSGQGVGDRLAAGLGRSDCVRIAILGVGTGAWGITGVS